MTTTPALPAQRRGLYPRRDGAAPSAGSVAAPVMSWPALRFAVAELEATRAMQREAVQARDDAAKVRELARRRVTRRPSSWLESERAVWGRHVELQRSLRALARESAVQHARCQDPVRYTTCPACEGALQ